MNKTFWVTLRNAPLYITLAAEKWCEENNVKDWSFNRSDIEINQAELTLSHISFSFTNDTDAMLFKLSFSQYL
jgi:hypothetical protein